VEGYVPDPLFSLKLALARYECLEAYKAFLSWLESLSFEQAKKIAPEVGINVACSVPKEVSRGVGTVIGIPGRLHLTPRGLRKLECPWWGGSDHMARLLLVAQKYGDVNVVMNIKYSKENVEALTRAGYKVVEVERAEQPRGIKTMKWIVEVAIRKVGKLPDAIYDRGFHGKEAMIRLLAKDLHQLKNMLLCVLSH
jgi:hydroxymethylpyrimidine/phosphomethylpyrimidine kinase